MPHHVAEKLRHHAIDTLAKPRAETLRVYLFPEGTRSRTGEINAFRHGIGILVAGTKVPSFHATCEARLKLCLRRQVAKARAHPLAYRRTLGV